MKIQFRKQGSTYMLGLGNSAVIKLIIAIGTCYVSLQLTKVIMLMVGYQESEYIRNIFNNVALPPLAFFKTKFWTVFTYGFFHTGFWDLFVNMLWLYCFGTVVQMFVGTRQIIPIFVYGMVVGGFCYLLCQFIPGFTLPGGFPLTGAKAGIMAFVTASIAISPKYRFYLSPTFSIPLLVVAGVFTLLMILYSNFNVAFILLLLGSGLTGYGYIVLLRNGYRPGEWAYDIGDMLNKKFTPSAEYARQKKHKEYSAMVSKGAREQGISQTRIDAILDKINMKGYKSLSDDEKELLIKAAQEK